MLLCALALGVVAMHHVGAEGHPGAAHAMSAPMLESATPQASGEHPATGGQHDPFHLCLAVLAGFAALVLSLWLLFTRRAPDPAATIRTASRALARSPPPRPGRDLLLTTCVFRL